MAELIDLVVSLLDEASACESCSVFINDARWRARLANFVFGDGKAADIAADWIVVAQLMDGGIFWHSDSVRALCMVGGEQLASGSRDKTIRVWDMSELGGVVADGDAKGAGEQGSNNSRRVAPA